MKNNDLLILANLRENSRETLTRISKRTNIPISTIFERLKNYDKNIVKKYTSLIDFTKIGFNTKALVMISPQTDTKIPVEEFLQKNRSVNSLYRVSTNFEYLAEFICRDLQEFHIIMEKLDSLKLRHKEVLFVIDDLKKEEFLVNSEFNPQFNFAGGRQQ